MSAPLSCTHQRLGLFCIGPIGSLTVQAGHTWHADEIQYRAQDDDRWMSAMMDRETRFILGYEMSSTKFGFDATTCSKPALAGLPNCPTP